MSDDKQPNYTTMSGAEFQRAVGADPAKWAEALMQAATCVTSGTPDDGSLKLYVSQMMRDTKTREERLAYIAKFFRDAMDAAVKAAKVRLDGD